MSVLLKQNLKNHLLTHSAIKPFKCSECSYECIKKSNLKLHLITHSAIKPFKCSQMQL
ncbi:UNVERIFIED_CONTAM: hypothetical protein GTU68_007341 [Idotea baltica]|nr:hypothetical protein [Idotea baltica]